MNKEATADEAITLTPAAIRQVAALIRKHGGTLEDTWFRMGVSGGGCSGLSYMVRLESEPRATDRRFEFDGVRVLVDPKSMRYLAGTRLDYDLTNLLEGGFRFDNPNAARSCGCGISFQAAP